MTEDSIPEDIPLQRSDYLVMRLGTPKGRGVFAKQCIPAGTVVETCPVLILSRSDVEATSKTILDSYTYNWPDPFEPRMQTQAVVFGLGSMFNHSLKAQNVGWYRSLGEQTVKYTALRDIEAGEELCINYGKVWFKDSDGLSESAEEDADDILGRIEVDSLN